MQALIQKTNRTHEKNYLQGRNIRTVLILYLTKDKTFSELDTLLNPNRKKRRQNGRNRGAFVDVQFQLGMTIPTGNIAEYNKWGGNFSVTERLTIQETNACEYSIKDSHQNNHEFPIKSLHSASVAIHIYYADTSSTNPIFKMKNYQPQRHGHKPKQIK